MSAKGLKTRDKIDPKYKWNIEAMISDESTIDPDLEKIKKQADRFASKFSGHLGDSAETLYDAFASSDRLMRKLEKTAAAREMPNGPWPRRKRSPPS